MKMAGFTHIALFQPYEHSANVNRKASVKLAEDANIYLLTVPSIQISLRMSSSRP